MKLNPMSSNKQQHQHHNVGAYKKYTSHRNEGKKHQQQAPTKFIKV